MELRDIKSFIEVANHRSFTKAAENTYISQPSLSKAVKKLEQELQVELFDRSSRDLQLTDAGKIVYKQGQLAFSSLNEMHNLLKELVDVAVGEIKFGIPPLIGTLFLPHIASTFKEKYPNVRLELVELGAKLIEQLVEEGKIDLGLIVLPVDESIFNIYPFFSDEFVLCIHREHPLAIRESVALHELKDEQFIIFSKNFTLHNFIINACKAAGFNPSISYKSSQWDLILELVASKLGITLLPKILFERQGNPTIKTIPLESPTLLWNLGLVTKKGAYHSFALRKFLGLFSTGRS
ncbi:LysR family transcriptional regulator [Lederbergia citri]|uniref:LysR family transcriptional regulator n=1 Tax=Lederbergia citri TaxID=2833580 RepID=A0A942TFN8_9BACI|nr:LysR family transcriptional regulator [Lederbergia citri]MBS4197141.1 LysR family transcriptional regulator [Lederbergia citri]